MDLVGDWWVGWLLGWYRMVFGGGGWLNLWWVTILSDVLVMVNLHFSVWWSGGGYLGGGWWLGWFLVWYRMVWGGGGWLY